MLLSFNQWSFSTIAAFHVLGSDSNKAQQEMSRQSQHFTCDVFECWDLTNLWTHFARRLLPVVDTSCSLLQRRAGFHPKKTAGPLCCYMFLELSIFPLRDSTCQRVNAPPAPFQTVSSGMLPQHLAISCSRRPGAHGKTTGEPLLLLRGFIFSTSVAKLRMVSK